MKTFSMPFLVNLIGFQLLWPAAVIGAAAGYPLLAWAVLAIMLLLMWTTGSNWRRDAKMLLVGFAACALVEPIWLGGGAIEYTDWSQRWLAPGWIWALWGGFAVSFFYCLAWLQPRLKVAALLGGIGGAVSVLMGVRLGAATAPHGEWILAVGYGAVWTLVVPLFAMLSREIVRAGNSASQGASENG